MSDALLTYADKLASLEKEFREMHRNLIKKKNSFNEKQQKVYNFVIGISHIIQFNINGEQYFIKRGGGKYKVFEHITN